MNRTLKLSIMLALLTGGGQAWAQNLGPVQMRSTMEQPLLAEIPLSGVSGSLDSVHVALASEEAFSRAGLSRDGLPVALSFAVARNAGGQPVIRVTSGSPVRDTYLDFLVEVSTGNNKVVREVTMLLDPPGTPISAPSIGAPAPTTHPSRTSDVPSRAANTAEPRPSRSEAAAVPPAAIKAPTRSAPRTAAAAAGSYGPVQRGQSLSAIAREHAGGGDMNQMLLALHKANPDAFYRDNINALKTGAVLRVPSPDDVQAQSAASAMAEVRRQNEAWRSGSARKPSVVADGAATGAAQDAGKPTPAANDRLAIVPSKDGGEAASTRAGTRDGKGDAQVAGLKQALTTQQENVASLKQQGAELTSRVTDLEAINTKNQRLLSLKDAEIAELQRKLADARKAGGQAAPASTAAAPPAAAPAQTPVTAPAATAPTTTTSAVATPLAVPAPAASSAPARPASVAPAATVATAPLKDGASTAPAAAPVKKPTGVTPVPVEDDLWYMQPWAWGGGAVVVLLLLVAAVFGRRKPKYAVEATPASLADRFGQQEPTFGEYGHNDAIDPDQREILDALAEHPDNIGLHLELVSLYYGRRDVDHFEAAAEAMFAHVADPDQPEWREVVTMGEDLAPTHPLFGGVPVDEIDAPYDTYTAGSPHTADEVAALEEFDLGHYVTSPEDDELTRRTEPHKHSEYHFNFDLTPVQRDEAEHRANAPDVFDVDAPESPYNEAPLHSAAHDYVDTPHEPHLAPASTFGDILGEQTRAHEEPAPSWSFGGDRDGLADVAAPLDESHGADTLSDGHGHHAEQPRFDEPRFDEGRRDEHRLDEPRFDEPPAFPTFPDEEPLADHVRDNFSDDPVDTKLDLARAYLDMGDAEGARLMLDEVIAEGTQMQKDTARRILDDIV
jgi:pilus assembly protein FimV